MEIDLIVVRNDRRVRREEKLRDSCFRYGLAILCLVAPLLFESIGFAAVVKYTPWPVGEKGFSYEILQTTSLSKNWESKEDGPVLNEQLVASYIGGQISSIALAGLRYLIAAIGIFFGLGVVWRGLGPRWAVGLCCVSFIVAGLNGWLIHQFRGGAIDPAAAVLAKAAQTALLSRFGNLGDLVVVSESWNFAFGMFGVCLIYSALLSVSIRDPSRVPEAGELARRLKIIQISLVSLSASLVVAALSTRLLLEWSLSLVSGSQRTALKPFSDAILLAAGTAGTVALLAAVTPAIAAWQLDVERYREHRAANSAAQPAPKSASSANQQQDEFQVTLLPMIGSILAALAPILTSPVFDIMKSIIASLK